jgi:cell wall-associated NlpC family hydrolase
LVAIPSSQAAPSRDLQEVEAQVRGLQMQAAAAHEEAERARATLAGIRDDLGRIESRRERERAEMQLTRGTIEDLARAVYATGGVDPTLQVLLADNPTEFLAQAAVMDQLSQVQVAQLRQIQTSRLRLAQTEAEISDREGLAQQARDEMASAEASVSERLSEAEQVMAQLQQEERERLEQLQEQRRQQQREEARQAAAALAASSPASGSSSDQSNNSSSSQSNDSSSSQSSGSSSGQSSGSGSTGPAQSGGGFSGGSRAQAVIQYALAQVGDQYSYSANPPNTWDCSKLTAAAWAQAGVGLTALSYTQWNQTRRVPVSEIQPGDLVFYFGSGAHHVGMYIGNGKMVHAANPTDDVEVTDFLGPWYRERFSGVGRVVG